MPLRVLQIVDSLAVSEATATVAAVSQGLAGLGIDVAMVGLSGQGNLSNSLARAGVQVRWIEPRQRHLFQQIHHLRQELQRFRPDVVHTWSEQANRLGRVTTLTTARPRLIASLRQIPRRPSLWMRPWEDLLARRTVAYVANSQTAFDFYRKHGIAREQLSLIPDGVAGAVTATETRRQRLRTELGIPANAKLVGAVGPLISSKRLKDAIWAYDLLRVFFPDIYMVVVGDGPERWRLERYARQVQDRRRTFFLGERADSREIVGGLDCLCQAGQRESAPRAVLEAMMAGVVVVATDIPGHRELIESNRSGRLVPLGDRGALRARAVQRAQRQCSHRTPDGGSAPVCATSFFVRRDAGPLSTFIWRSFASAAKN